MRLGCPTSSYLIVFRCSGTTLTLHKVYNPKIAEKITELIDFSSVVIKSVLRYEQKVCEIECRAEKVKGARIRYQCRVVNTSVYRRRRQR